MSKILGLNLGTNSIGWAIIDNEYNKTLESGVSSFPNNSLNIRAKRRLSRRYLQKLPSKKENKYLDKSNLTILCIVTISIATGVLALVNEVNWQYWINLSLTFLVALLTLIYHKGK